MTLLHFTVIFNSLDMYAKTKTKDSKKQEIYPVQNHCTTQKNCQKPLFHPRFHLPNYRFAKHLLNNQNGILKM